MGSSNKTVSVVGLEQHGLRIATLLQDRGFKVTALDPFRRKTSVTGLAVTMVRNLEQAIEASDTVIVCVDDHAVMDARLCSPCATYALHGKALLSLNVSTSRPAATARAIASWARSKHIDFLEADLLSDAELIGAQACELVCSGPDRSRERLHDILSILGPDYINRGHDQGYARLREPRSEVHSIS